MTPVVKIVNAQVTVHPVLKLTRRQITFQVFDSDTKKPIGRAIPFDFGESEVDTEAKMDAIMERVSGNLIYVTESAMDTMPHLQKFKPTEVPGRTKP